MIVGEDGQPQSPMDSKSTAGPPPPLHQADQHAGRAPPSYQQAYQSPYPTHAAGLYAEHPYPESAGRRFLKAFGIATLVWVLVGMMANSVVDLGIGHSHRHGRWSVDVAQDGPLGEVGPQRGDGDAEHCLSGYDWIRDDRHPPIPHRNGQFEVSKTFQLPADADHLYLLSRGVSSVGAIELVPSEDEGDKLKVEVRARYDWQNVIEEAQVCLLKRKKNEHGLGIYTPSRWEHPDSDNYKHPIRWQVTVTFPAKAKIANFSTHMSLFAHHLGDLDGNVAFKTLSLSSSNTPIEVESVFADKLTFHTTNSPIKAQSLSATYVTLETTNSPIGGTFRGVHDLSVHTSNGPITGTFNTSENLVLKTSNAPIEADIFIDHVDGKKASSALLKTSNSPLKAEFTLKSTTKSGDGGAFHVDTTTSNGPLKLAFAEAPVDSLLDVTARSSTMGVTVALPVTYEGRFHASSSLSGPKLTLRDDVEDPKGKERKRAVSWNVDKRRTTLDGTVKWADGGERRGNVDVRTSLSTAEIIL